MADYNKGPEKKTGSFYKNKSQDSGNSGRGDRPRRPYGEGGGSDRPRRPYGEGGGSDRPRRPYGEGGGSDRPRRPYGEGGGSDRPRRPYGEGGGSDRPRRPYGEGGGSDRPRRPYGEGGGSDRPIRRIQRDKVEIIEATASIEEPVLSPLPINQQEEPVIEVSPVTVEDAPWFKRLLALTTEKGREKEGRFLAEGQKCVQEISEHQPDLVDGVYHLQSFSDTEFLENLRKQGQRTHDLEVAQMERLTDLANSQGILAVCRAAATKPSYETARLLTLVDAVQDPGNLGAIYRTSLGFGMDGILLGKGTVNPFNGKVVRGSAGTFLRVPFETGVDLLERMDFLRRKGFTIVATSLHAKENLDAVPASRLRKVAILVGNEGSGADPGLIKHADEVIKIPMQKGLESLNVAVAHGILSAQIAQIIQR